MVAFNSVSLITGGLKFTAKYPASAEKSPNNPLKGYFNYIHLTPLLHEMVNGSINNEYLLKKAIHQFHEQQLPTIKIKLFGKESTQLKNSASPSDKETLKVSRQLNSVSINHGNFNTDQIAIGDGNSKESLSYSIRVRSKNLQQSNPAAIEALLKESSSTIHQVEKAIRQAVSNGQALEVGLQHAESILLPELKQQFRENSFDLKTKLKRTELFTDTTIVIGSTQYPAETRALWKNNHSKHSLDLKKSTVQYVNPIVEETT